MRVAVIGVQEQVIVVLRGVCKLTSVHREQPAPKSGRPRRPGARPACAMCVCPLIRKMASMLDGSAPPFSAPSQTSVFVYRLRCTAHRISRPCGRALPRHRDRGGSHPAHTPPTHPTHTKVAAQLCCGSNLSSEFRGPLCLP